MTRSTKLDTISFMWTIILHLSEDNFKIAHPPLCVCDTCKNCYLLVQIVSQQNDTCLTFKQYNLSIFASLHHSKSCTMSLSLVSMLSNPLCQLKAGVNISIYPWAFFGSCAKIFILVFFVQKYSFSCFFVQKYSLVLFSCKNISRFCYL